jgi:hypothetical protein
MTIFITVTIRLIDDTWQFKVLTIFITVTIRLIDDIYSQ